jgi:hypothetical protein
MLHWSVILISRIADQNAMAYLCEWGQCTMRNHACWISLTDLLPLIRLIHFLCVYGLSRLTGDLTPCARPAPLISLSRMPATSSLEVTVLSSRDRLQQPDAQGVHRYASTRRLEWTTRC